MKTRLLFPCAFVTLAQSVHAAPLWWDNSTADGLWASVANWSTVVGGGTDPGAVPGSGDVATFSATGVVSPQVITLSGPQSVQGIVVETAGITTLQSTGGAQTLSIGAGGINVSAAAVTAFNVGPAVGPTAVNVLLTADQSWTWGGSNTAATQGIFVRGSVSNADSGHTLTLGGTIGSTAISVISGTISDGAGVMNIVVNGGSSNRWTFSNSSNNYTGTTTITSGALGISSANALGATGASSGTSVASGASLFIRTSIASIAAESLSIAGTGAGGAGALRNVSGDSTWNGAIAANAASTVSIGTDGGALTLSTTADITTTGTGTLAFTTTGGGVINVNGDISGGAAVTKTSAAGGFVTLGGDAKTYTGATTASVGTLTINTTLTQTSGLTVASAGILRGDNGVLGLATADTTVNGILRPGALNSTIGNLTLGDDITFGTTGRFEADIQSSTLTGDQVIMTGDLNIDGSNAAILAVADLNVAAITSGTIILLKYGGLWNGGLFTVDGTVITDNGNTFLVNGNTYQLDYDLVDGAGHALALVATVPEPASALLALVASAGFAFRRRRSA